MHGSLGLHPSRKGVLSHPRSQNKPVLHEATDDWMRAGGMDEEITHSVPHGPPYQTRDVDNDP